MTPEMINPVLHGNKFVLRDHFRLLQVSINKIFGCLSELFVLSFGTVKYPYYIPITTTAPSVTHLAAILMWQGRFDIASFSTKNRPKHFNWLVFH